MTKRKTNNLKAILLENMHIVNFEVHRSPPLAAEIFETDFLSRIKGLIKKFRCKLPSHFYTWNHVI